MVNYSMGSSVMSASIFLDKQPLDKLNSGKLGAKCYSRSLQFAIYIAHMTMFPLVIHAVQELSRLYRNAVAPNRLSNGSVRKSGKELGWKITLRYNYKCGTLAI